MNSQDPFDMTKKPQKLDSELTLNEIANELQSIPIRLAELKSERDKWASMPLTRAELHEKAKAWFAQKTETGAADLLARLKNSGFMTTDEMPDLAILLNGSASSWRGGAVDAQNVGVIFAPLLGQFVNDWVSALPESEVGTATRDECAAALAAIDNERAQLVERRARLKRLLIDADTAATTPGFDPIKMQSGGRVANLDVERLEQKFFQARSAA